MGPKTIEERLAEAENSIKSCAFDYLLDLRNLQITFLFTGKIIFRKFYNRFWELVGENHEVDPEPLDRYQRDRYCMDWINTFHARYGDDIKNVFLVYLDGRFYWMPRDACSLTDNVQVI